MLRALLGGRLFVLSLCIGCASMMLTLSFWGIAAATVYFAVYLGSVGKPRLVLQGAAFAAIVAAIAVAHFDHATVLVLDYLETRMTLEDVSGAEKFEAWTNVADRFLDYALLGSAFTHVFCEGCASPQDAGVFLNSIVYFGLLPTISLLVSACCGVKRRLGWWGMVAATPLLFAKYYVIDALWWLVLFSGIGAIWAGSARQGRNMGLYPGFSRT